jgi:N-acetylglutamate synthase-like GNAT family acetyltransferase
MTHSLVTIRRATSDDARSVNALMQASRAYSGQYRSILDGYEITSLQIERDQMYVAVEGARVRGFYSLIVNATNPELDLLFVSDDAQGRGIGLNFITHLKQLASSLGIGAIKIVSHPPTLGFSLRIGAQLVETVPPSGKVSWEHPLLTLRIATPQHPKNMQRPASCGFMRAPGPLL